jgi:membrane protease YdiL (CAAX protease family)
LAKIALIAAALGLAACSRPLQHARTEKFQPVFPAERAAKARIEGAACSPSWGFLFPGLGHLCLRESGQGAALLTLGAAELATVIAVASSEPEGIEHPGAAIAAVAFQDLWVYGAVSPIFTKQLAKRALYTPQDSAADLLAAPYNIEVMKRPEVWAGLLGMLSLGIGVSLLVDENASADRLGDDADIFGHNMAPATGYPAAYAAGTGLFYHVAIAEEVLFRGIIQSSLARRGGETRGWINASLLFGAVHAFNALALPADERKEYLFIGVPFITAIGSYIGWSYRHADYSLAPPVAIHFWYDFLLSATFFAMDPQNSPISARISVPF